MLYEDLKELTNGKCTREEYEVINQLYMTCDSMTTITAAKIWEESYGVEHKHDKIQELILGLNNSTDESDPLSPDDCHNAYQVLMNAFDKALISKDGRYIDNNATYTIVRFSDKYMGLSITDHNNNAFTDDIGLRVVI